MRNQKAILEARVKGVNAANAFANELYPRLVSVFGSFIGEKITKVDGDLMQKVVKGIESLAFPNTVKISVYRYRSDYSIVYVVKTCEQVDGIAYYHESSVYVGEMSNGVLTKLCNPPALKTDYNADVVAGLRVKHEAAKKAASEAESALFPFGEYDR